MKEREYNYDWLRVCSMIAVIMIHVSSTWVHTFAYDVQNGANVVDLKNPLFACIFHTISRFAVPSFVMISGAFILDDDNNTDIVKFYKKAFSNIVIPTLLFSIFYLLYNIGDYIHKKSLTVDNVLMMIKNTVAGNPYYHMWYLYMLMGLYIMAPFVVIVRKRLSYNQFRKMAIVMLVYTIVSGYTSRGQLMSWDIGTSVHYLGYFVMGYVLRKDAKKSTKSGILYLLLGIILEIVSAFIEYHFMIVRGIQEWDLKFGIVTPLTPLIVIASIFIFKFFGSLELNNNIIIKKLAELSFAIYLIHAGVWDVIKKVIHKFNGEVVNFNNIWAVPVAIVIVLFISIILSSFYNIMYTKIRKSICI